MGLLSIIRKQKLKDRQIRVLVLGLDNAGKTTVVKALLDQDTSSISPTMGFTIHSLDLRGHMLDIWDVGGQKSLRPFWQNYFDKTDFLVWVLDASTFDERLDAVKQELHTTLNEDRLLGASLVLLINKIDLVPNKNVENIVAALNLDTLGNHHIKIVPCSALQDSEPIKQAFDWIVDDAEKRLFLLSP